MDYIATMSTTAAPLAMPAAPCHVVELVAALLARCRADAGRLRQALNTIEEVRTLDRIRAEATIWFREVDDEELENDHLEDLQREVCRWTEEAPPSVVARALAEAADDAIGARFLGYFRDRGICSIATLCAVPVVNPPLESVIGGRLNTDPDRLGVVLDRTRRLALPPCASGGLTVRVDASSADALAGLFRAPLRVAALLPNPSSDDFSWRTELREGRGRFFAVRPKDEAGQQERVASLLRQAAAAGAKVVVLPELSATPEILEAVRGIVREPGTPLRLVVAGSMHLDQGSRRRNTATAVTAAHEWTHDKFNPYSYKEDGQVFVEDIEFVAGESGVTIIQDETWSLSVVVCKDLLDPKLADVLAELQVRLVLVPSWSEQTDAFVERSHRLCTDSRTLVFIATLAGPDSTEAASALAALPLRASPHRIRYRALVEPPDGLIIDVSAPNGMEWERIT